MQVPTISAGEVMANLYLHNTQDVRTRHANRNANTHANKHTHTDRRTNRQRLHTSLRVTQRKEKEKTRKKRCFLKTAADKKDVGGEDNCKAFLNT